MTQHNSNLGLLTDVVVAWAVLVALGNCGPCANKDDIKLYDRNNPSNPVCWPFPKCNDGQESTVKPGSSHPHGTKIACINCHEGYFSNNHTNKRCRRCTSCVNNKELSPCQGSRDRQCSNSCISSNFYFNSTDQQCYPCTECCGASDEDIELQCVSSRVGTVVGGNGEKHCKASFKLSQQCSNEPPLERNVSSSPACANSSVTNSSTLEARECSCGSSFSIDSLHIALISVLGLVLPIVLLFGYRWCVSRRQSSRSGYTGMPPCIPNYTDCYEKLKLIPEGMKIDKIEPYQVEVILTESLDVIQRCVKNWWDVGRTLGISVSELRPLKQEYKREDGSPTKCLLEILRTRNVVSLRTFVEITHKLNRHDICKAIYEVYKSQETTV